VFGGDIMADDRHCAVSLSSRPSMTVGHLLDMLSKLDPDLRVLVPGQEWGWADLGRISKRTVAFAPADERSGMGAWITQQMDAPGAPRERCVLMVPSPSRKRARRQAKSL
jgi:hypothetical protein